MVPGSTRMVIAVQAGLSQDEVDLLTARAGCGRRSRTIRQGSASGLLAPSGGGDVSAGS